MIAPSVRMLAGQDLNLTAERFVSFTLSLLSQHFTQHCCPFLVGHRISTCIMSSTLDGNSNANDPWKGVWAAIHAEIAGKMQPCLGRLDALEAAMSTLQKDVQASDDDDRSLHNNPETPTEKIEALEKAVQNRDRRVGRLNDQVENLTSDSKALQEQVQNLRDQLQDRDQEVSDRDERIVALESELRETSTRCEGVKAELSAAQGDIRVSRTFVDLDVRTYTNGYHL